MCGKSARLTRPPGPSRRSEQRVLKDFARIVEPVWCHEVTVKDRETYISKRLAGVPSPESVDADLRVLRMLFNVLESWKHVTERSSPFSGKGRATVGVRRKREREKGRKKASTYFTRAQVKAILDQAAREVESPSDDWKAERLRALVYFEAYSGVRIEEALYLEWSDIDWETGTANVNFKIDHDLKTQASDNPIGLPDLLSFEVRPRGLDRGESGSLAPIERLGRPPELGPTYDTWLGMSQPAHPFALVPGDTAAHVLPA